MAFTEGFQIGQRIRVSPHDGPRGNRHKGNAEIISVGEAPSPSTGQCIMPDCDYTEDVFASEDDRLMYDWVESSLANAAWVIGRNRKG